MKETIAAIVLGIALTIIILYLIVRPLIAIGDIPSEIRKLKESIDNLSEIIKNKEGEKE